MHFILLFFSSVLVTASSNRKGKMKEVVQSAVKKSQRQKKAVSYVFPEGDSYSDDEGSSSWKPTSKQIVAAGKSRSAGGSFGPDTKYGKPYEKAQFEILSAIQARALERDALGLPKYPRQVFSPKNEEEANLRHDAQILFDFPRRIEKGNLPLNGRCVKLYNEIEKWKEEMFQMNKAAEEGRILQRLLDIKERALQREAEGGQKYPRRIQGTQQDYDACALKKVPKFPAGLALWNEIQAWKNEDGEKSRWESRAEGKGPRKKGRGQFVEPTYNTRAREFEKQQSHSMRLRSQMLKAVEQLPLDTDGELLPELFGGALPEHGSDNPGPSHLPHDNPSLASPSRALEDFMNELPEMDEQNDRRVSTTESNPRPHFTFLISCFILAGFVLYFGHIKSTPQHYDSLATYVEL